MLAGGLFTDLFAVESHMRLAGGDTKNYSETSALMELAVIDTTDTEFDQVTAIPEAVLRRNRTIEHGSLPFQIVVRNFFQNSRLQMASESVNNRFARHFQARVLEKIPNDNLEGQTGMFDRSFAAQ